MSASNADEQRAESRERWDRAAAGWGKRAERVREHGMPVSMWMIDRVGLHPGERVLELAAGPGDTGFLAAELIRPGGTLISSDASERMLEIARARAAQLGIANVEFAELELEWIDLETASVDVILCRWGVMLSVDPDAAAREARRVLKPGGRIALAVWDEPQHNPWATIPGRVLVDRGLAGPPDPDAPGMFALAAPGRLADLLESAGFLDVVVEAVTIERAYPSVERFVDETLDLSPMFADVFLELDEDGQRPLQAEIERLAVPFATPDGGIVLPGQTLVAAASA
ncbi:MAG TPA: class I SAM-dependent methyltransferase [Solirubrobacteraceae bacterium]|nr:class I SAM-dependent methyltransferase [Solirubrobacteraceae bacterium]